MCLGYVDKDAKFEWPKRVPLRDPTELDFWDVLDSKELGLVKGMGVLGLLVYPSKLFSDEK